MDRLMDRYQKFLKNATNKLTQEATLHQILSICILIMTILGLPFVFNLFISETRKKSSPGRQNTIYENNYIGNTVKKNKKKWK